jgi:hypothetical protein
MYRAIERDQTGQVTGLFEANTLARVSDLARHFLGHPSNTLTYERVTSQFVMEQRTFPDE